MRANVCWGLQGRIRIEILIVTGPSNVHIGTLFREIIGVENRCRNAQGQSFHQRSEEQRRARGSMELAEGRRKRVGPVRRSFCQSLSIARLHHHQERNAPRTPGTGIAHRNLMSLHRIGLVSSFVGHETLYLCKGALIGPA